MKRAFVCFGSVVCCLLAVLFVGILVGCEDGSSTRALTVSPSEVSLTLSNSTVTFAVEASGSNTTSGLSDLSLPLEWRVANEALGSIVGSEGTVAVYSRTTNSGVNIVTARDQYGAEGMATVNQ